MAHPDRVDPARLYELEAVTREYATYSLTSHGIAFVGTGVVVLATLALDLVAHQAWIRFGYSLLPAMWLLGLAASRAYYQRHGTVVEIVPPELRGYPRNVFLVLVYVVSSLGAVLIATRLEREQAGAMIGGVLAMFGIVAVPLLTAALAATVADVALTMVLLVGGVNVTDPNAGTGLRLVPAIMLSLVAAVCLLQGLRQHARYRSLERRLGALRGGA